MRKFSNKSKKTNLVNAPNALRSGKASSKQSSAISSVLRSQRMPIKNVTKDDQLIPVKTGSPFKIVASHDADERKADNAAEQISTASEKGQHARKVMSNVHSHCRTSLKKSEDDTEVNSKLPSGWLQSGRILPPASRRFFEKHIGADLSGVRIHTDPQTTRIAEALNANAFTLGRNIGFADGKFNPDSKEGRRLLAHELSHVVQQSSDSQGIRIQRDGPGSDTAVDLENRLEQLIPAEGGSRSQGPVEEETAEQAEEYLSTVRTILSDVHRDVNTLLQLVREISGLVSTDFIDSELLLSILYEGLDALSIAVPEEAEAVTTVIAKSIKVIIMAIVRQRQAEESNRRTLSRLQDIEGLFELLIEAQTRVDELKSRVHHDPELAGFFASQPVPPVPRRTATGISREIEVRLLAAMLRRSGATIETEETDTVVLPPSESYMDTDENEAAFDRHNDPVDNFWLRRQHIRREWSYLSFQATENTEYSWYYYTIAGVNEEIIDFTLGRLQRIGMPKARLFEVMLGSALEFR